MSQPVAKASQLIRCAVADAFDAFVDPARITRFWLRSASAPLAPGAVAEWQFMVPGAAETVAVTAFDAPRTIAFDWSDGLRVRLEFDEPGAGATRVAVTVEGFAGDGAVEQAVGATEGFAIVLCDLKTWLETGRSAHLVRDKARLIALQAPPA